MMCINFNTA